MPRLDVVAILLGLLASEFSVARRTEQDLIFHSTIHLAAGNRVCEHMFTSVNRAMMTSIRVTTHRVPYQHTIAFHTPI